MSHIAILKCPRRHAIMASGNEMGTGYLFIGDGQTSSSSASEKTVGKSK
jgi:hypothetical protein